MPVTPRGIVSPDGGDGYDLVVDLATQASTTDTAISNAVTGIENKMANTVYFTAPYTAAPPGSSGTVYFSSGSVPIPNPRAVPPTVAQVNIVPSDTSGVQWVGNLSLSATNVGFRLFRIGVGPSNGTALITLHYA